MPIVVIQVGAHMKVVSLSQASADVGHALCVIVCACITESCEKNPQVNYRGQWERVKEDLQNVRPPGDGKGPVGGGGRE